MSMTTGYKRSLLKITFTDEEFAGLEIRAKRISIGKLLGLLELRHLKESADTDPEVREALQQLFRDLSKTLVSWNLEDTNPDDPDGPGIPVPITPSALEDLDFELVMAIVNAIRDAGTDVPAPLGTGSSSGDQLLEASLPMEVSSPSPAS